MQKPLTYDRQGFAKEKLNQYSSANLPINQESRISELSNCISDQRLTESLEILEKAGYHRDTAIFILASLQSLEVAA